jgi:protein-tyrosine-phosphatase
MKVLFLCYSNKGRSPALSAYTRDFLKDSPQIEIDSAGIGLENIESLRKRNMDLASRTTTQILSEQGIDISDHRLQYVGEVIKGSSLILSSDELTLARTKAEFPYYSQRYHLARQFAGFTTQLEIFGPYAESRRDPQDRNWTERQGYEHMLREIKSVSKKIAEKLRNYQS